MPDHIAACLNHIYERGACARCGEPQRPTVEAIFASALRIEQLLSEIVKRLPEK